MTDALAELRDFYAAWSEPLEKQAQVMFEAKQRTASSAVHTAIANEFTESLGLQSIGPHWEMLDDMSGDTAPRSALAAFADALSNNMVFSKTRWLGPARAREFGRGFMDCFDPSRRMVLTNRLDMGWNPISSATFEWAFVLFDDEKIALLLLTAED